MTGRGGRREQRVTKQPPRAPEHTKIKNVSDTIRVPALFFRRFRGPSCERPSAHVSTLQISKKLLSDQRRVLE